MRETGKKKKILYVMHVDWNWIKQRPHFLAEGLSSSYNILVLYHFTSNRSVLVKNTSAIKHYPIIRLPFSRFALIAKANEVIQKIFFTVLIKIYNPDIVWITFPTLFSHIAKNDMRNRMVVYDCMDNAKEFEKTYDLKKRICSAEQQIMDRADLILSSSENLMEIMVGRGCNRDKIFLIRNAFDDKTLIHFEKSISAPETGGTACRVCYVGTVGDYIDFETILYCVHNLPFVEFHFIGPVLTRVPAHERIAVHGPVDHTALAHLVSQYDLMILPFKLNDLIRGVDPVKLYEYINFNKKIIAVYYDEIRRFDKFVIFYRDREGLLQAISQARNTGTKYSQNDRLAFLSKNSWNERVSDIVRLLTQRLSEKAQAKGDDTMSHGKRILRFGMK